MAIIYNYPLNSILLAEDMLIGTSTKIVNGQPKNATKNFSIADLTGFIKQNVSLDDVLQVGNTSLLDAKIGKLYLYDTPVADYGNIALNQNRFSFSTVTHGEVFRTQRDMFSSFSSSGYRGSFEVSNITANRVWDFPNESGTVALLSDMPSAVWGSITGDIEDQTDLIDYISSQITTPTLQQVTDEGNETTNRIIVNENNALNTLYGDGLELLDLTNGNSTLYGQQGISNNGNGYCFSDNPIGGFKILATTDDITTPTLQSVTDEGNTTTNIITIGSLADNYTIIYPNTIGTVNAIDTLHETYAYLDNSGYLSLGNGDAESSLKNTNVTNQGVILEFPDKPTGSYTIATTDDVPLTPTLQQVLDNNHDLVDNNNFQGTNAGVDNTGIGVNAFGEFAASSNTGNAINALGNGAGVDNTGNAVNALGQETAVENIGNDVNALGFRAGGNNTFNNVNLFGETAQADENGQTVLSKDGTIMARLSTTDLTATRKYNLPNASGTLALTSDIPAAGVTSVGLTMPSAFNVTNSPITSSGDIAVTGAGSVSQYVRGDGTLANFPNSTGGGSSVNYYLNGSVSQGTFGGTTYYQMSKTPILGGGTNFTRTNGAGNGYIASFITDAGDPSFLNIPGGNWNLEFYFQSSASGGSPQFYGEIYKVSATNVFTLVASGSANPEGITNGTTVDQYFTSISVPQTSLLITDRLAIRIYVITGGRTITLHTENGNLCEVLTTFTTGLTALNGLTQQVQYFDEGTTGTDFNISSTTDTHTFNLPTASATNRGALSSTDWSTFNEKQGKSTSAYSFRVNNTNATANATETTYRNKGIATYTSGIVFTATTSPSGTTNHSYNWIQIGNLVTLNINLLFSITGTSVQNVSMTLPTDCPTPLIQTGMPTSALTKHYIGSGRCTSGVSAQSTNPSPECNLRKNAPNTGFEIYLQQTAGAFGLFQVTIQYFT